jgi:hypothetical protein
MQTDGLQALACLTEIRHIASRGAVDRGWITRTERTPQWQQLYLSQFELKCILGNILWIPLLPCVISPFCPPYSS